MNYMLLLYISILIIYVVYTVIILYILFNWSFDNDDNTEQSDTIIPISVIIAARNEAKNIPNLLQSLSLLQYNKKSFEIIIVNDHSEDNTFQILQDFELSNLKILNLPIHLTGKKHALNYGIRQAKNELIVCTDADCIVPLNWLSSISTSYAIEKWKFCAMPVKFGRSKSRFEYFQTMDFLGLMGVTFVANTKAFFWMANGANMAFTKSAFEEVKGFECNLDRVSGDDMFLIKAISEKYPNRVETLFNEDVLVSTLPEQTITSFLNQRFRWGSKNKGIESPSMNITMLVVWLASFLLIVQGVFIACKWSEMGQWLLVVSLITKLMIDFIYLRRLSYDFKIKHSILKYISSFLINTFYTGLIAPITIVITNFKWKGRINNNP